MVKPTRNHLKQILSDSAEVTVNVHGLTLTAYALAAGGAVLKCRDAGGAEYLVTLFDENFARVTKAGRSNAVARETRYSIETTEAPAEEPAEPTATPKAIARREGDQIIPTCIMGDLTIIHESESGVLVVREGSRKHWRKGKPDLPTRYLLMRLVVGAEQPHHYRRMLFNSRHLAEYPLVLLNLGVSVEPGRQWREHRQAMIKKADSL
jgi:hypothetical protein